MKYFSILSLVLILVFYSCAKKTNVNLEKKIPWGRIEISTRNQTVIVYEELDTASYQNVVYKQIGKKAFMGTYKLEKIEHSNFKIKSVERDSLYSYVLKMITKPYSPKVSCTDYVGNVSIKLINNNTVLSCEYNSVCDWTTVSPETQKIYDFLKSKIKLSRQ